MDESIPPVLARLLTAEVAQELAGVYQHQAVFPDEIMLDQPDRADRLFPGWPTPVLVIAFENQAVCQWGVPLDGNPDPPVILGGEVHDPTTSEIVRTCVHAPTLEAFIAARRWDGRCLDGGLEGGLDGGLDGGTLIQAQYRFQRDQTRIMLWTTAEQCDWWISDPDVGRLRDTVRSLMDLSDLRQALWAADEAGEQLLRDLRQA